ncbi:MAG: YraN family protein [gamma proteobacterium symbiont of Taylorina sp.]|nr:YraN family protein [gamma proteobacterium symbiont of Taylorina sp.]
MLRFIKDHNQKGQYAENIALKYLQTQGLKKIQANFSCKCGEIDLIMTDNTFIIFIEVRYRKKIQFGHPLETITYSKQQKIIKTIQFFLMKNPDYYQFPCRIDAVALYSENYSKKTPINNIDNEDLQIEWVRNAIQLTA